MPIVAQQRILIFADDPRLCRLLLREANAAGFEGIATTEPDKLEKHYRSSVPDIIFMEVDGPLDRVKRFFECLSAYQSGSLVLLSGVNGPQLGELLQLANALGVNIAGILHKPMGIDAIRTVLRNQKRGTPRLQARPTTQGVNHERKPFTR